MKNDYLKWAALLAALVATASAEYELARQVGFNQWVAAAVPGALDIYTVRALRAHRDVLAAVAAMIGVNAASHLVTAGLLPVNVPLVVAVSAIAPLVLWRVHRLADEATTAVTEAVVVESDSTAKGLAATETPAAEPTSVDVIHTDLAGTGNAKGPQTASTPAAEEPRTRVSVSVPEDDELLARTRTDFHGQIPTYRELKDQYGIGQARARRIRSVLEGELS